MDHWTPWMIGPHSALTIVKARRRVANSVTVHYEGAGFLNYRYVASVNSMR